MARGRITDDIPAGIVYDVYRGKIYVIPGKYVSTDMGMKMNFLAEYKSPRIRVAATSWPKMAGCVARSKFSLNDIYDVGRGQACKLFHWEKRNLRENHFGYYALLFSFLFSLRYFVFSILFTPFSLCQSSYEPVISSLRLSPYFSINYSTARDQVNRDAGVDDKLLVGIKFNSDYPLATVLQHQLVCQ